MILSSKKIPGILCSTSQKQKNGREPRGVARSGTSKKQTVPDDRTYSSCSSSLSRFYDFYAFSFAAGGGVNLTHPPQKNTV